MATSIKGIRPVKQLTIRVPANAKLDQLTKTLQGRLTRLGCPTCLSGLNRFILEDPVAGRFR